MVFSALSFPDLGPQRAMIEWGVSLFPCGIKGEKNYLFLQIVKKRVVLLRCFVLPNRARSLLNESSMPPQWVLIAPHRVSGILAAELQQQKLRQFLQPAAYPECELRRIVCWLLIVSAEIWKIYFPDSTFSSRCGTSFVEVYQNKKMQN